MIAKKEEYVFNALAEWTLRRSGIIEQTGAVPESIDFSAPPEFHGEENKWSPETLLLASVAACFISTFDAIAEIFRFYFQYFVRQRGGHSGKRKRQTAVYS